MENCEEDKEPFRYVGILQLIMHGLWNLYDTVSLRGLQRLGETTCSDR